MELQEATRRALEIRRGFERYEERTYGRRWTLEDLTLGFVGDVGDLAKLVQAKQGVRAVPDGPTRLEHELADCLWSLLVIAHECGVDIESAFSTTMAELERMLAG
jgi:NTP pyrophosphatase (non-canonical NTP hydrolase)